ncbi:MAG: hypothetical protein K2Y37_06935 [Pirellulales bacterium]|nr:hypothetical protein [Pirellulales bacterium]
MASDATRREPPVAWTWLDAIRPWRGLLAGFALAVALVGWGWLAGNTPSRVLAERRAQVAGYAPAAKNRLARNFERFERLDPAEQARRIELEAALAADPRESELRETMHRYQQWLKSLSSSQRAELRTLPIDNRVARIGELRHAQEVEAARRQDQRAVAALIESRLLAQVSDQAQREKLAAAPEFARRAVLFRQLGPQAMQEMRRDLTPDELAALEPQMSELLRQQLHNAGSDENRQRLIAQRMRDVRRQLFEGDGLALLTWMGNEVEPQLDRFFRDDLTEAQRESLLSLPPDQMRFRLRRLYLHEKFPEVFPDRGSWWESRGGRERNRDRDRGRGRSFPGPERRGPSGRPGDIQGRPGDIQGRPRDRPMGRPLPTDDSPPAQ